MITIKIFKYFLIETGSYSNESEAKMPKLMKYFLHDSKYIVFNEFSMLCEALKVELNGMNIDKLNKIMEKYDEKADLDIEMQQPRRYNRAWTVTGVSSADMKKVRTALPTSLPETDTKQAKPALQPPPPQEIADKQMQLAPPPPPPSGTANTKIGFAAPPPPPPSMKATNVTKKEKKKKPDEMVHVSNPLFMKKKRSKSIEKKTENKKKRLSANRRLSASVLTAMNLSESEVSKMASI